MLLDFLTTYAWIVWLALILVFVIIEVTTLEFTFLMLAVGSLGGLVSGLLNAPWWLQVIIAGVLSILLLFVVRPALLRALKRGADPAKSNVEALIGLTGVVTNDYSGNASHVKLSNGDTWTARRDDHEPLVEGQRITVTAIDGATAVVAPVERTAS
ncbi:NfeD family protein [Salinibacterium soli]|uniref:NfeD family protein n=1 Tax=Antiquaquibacter soli TaxID=3064523 RepID=A0ABT9BLH2_9MICO|nr:NfeD family protein [Protaetiibacter sp. WY-16]MDO7881869.1 NfeD family protein [Protaetiibacter sp. WY-16]